MLRSGGGNALLSVTVRVIPANTAAPLPAEGVAKHLHGWLFRALRRWDPELADFVHAAPVKPFSLAPAPAAPGAASGGPSSDASAPPDPRAVDGDTGTEGDAPHAPAGRDADGNGQGEPAYRVASLHPALDDALAGIFGEEEVAAELGGAAVRLLPAWDGSPVTYAQLLEESPAATYVDLEFLTPTGFRQKGRQVVFPAPEPVFESLWHRWNLFASERLPDLRGDFPEVLVSRFRIRSRPAHFDGYVIIGAVGQVTYHLPRRLPAPLRSHVAALARYAEFAGVGYGVTHGLGAVRLRGIR
jgi:hypothetical protein